MQLHMRFTNGLEVKGDHELLENILLGQLARFQHRLKQVHLHIEDVNGPRGGLDKHCRCVLHLRRTAPIVICDRDKSLPAMIHRVADRASHALGRRSARRIDSKQRPKRTDT